MRGPGYYCRTLNYSGAAVDRCMQILGYWKPGMDAAEIYEKMLSEGREAKFSASSLRHAVSEVFKLRFLSEEALPWTKTLKQARHTLYSAAVEQICFLLTARCEAMLTDFLIKEYWPRVRHGDLQITADILSAFLSLAVSEGIGGGKWTESRFNRATRSLSAVCAGFHLIKRNSTGWKITPPKLLNEIALFLAYELKDRGLKKASDICSHKDWLLYGLGPEAVKGFLTQSYFGSYFVIPDDMKGLVVWRFDSLSAAVDHYVS